MLEDKIIWENHFFVIGLTGSLGAGKTTVAEILKKEGCIIFNADEEAKKLYEKPEIREKIIDKLGRESYTLEGKINRTFLSEKIFKDDNLLKWIESLIHPEVNKEFFLRLKNARKGDIFVYDAALLLESTKNNKEFFDFILVIDAPLKLRMKRAKERSNFSNEQFYEREKKQLSSEIKKKLADYVIINDREINFLEKEVKELLNKIKQNQKRGNL